MRYKIYPEKIHLVSSSVFAENMSAYSGNPLYTAAEFQREIVNNIIKTSGHCAGEGSSSTAMTGWPEASFRHTPK